MLLELKLNRFTLIHEAHLSFKKGLTVFTGETGAGKSILMDAVALLMGKPASEDFISDGSEEAWVEGVFRLKGIPEVFQLYVEPGEPLMVYRKLSRKGSNVVRVNGQTMPLKQLKQGMASVLNIIGQHDYMALFETEYQRFLLDSLGESSFQALKRQYRKAYHDYLELKKSIETSYLNDEEKARKVEFLAFQINDIESMAFCVGEEETLLDQKKNSVGREKQLAKLNGVLHHMNAFEEALFVVQKELKSYDAESIRVLIDHIEAFSIQLAEGIKPLLSQKQHLDSLDAVSIDTIESRLEEMFRYKTKYKVLSVDQLLDLKTKFQTEMDSLTARVESHKHAQENLAALKLTCTELAKQLYKGRLSLAEVLQTKIIKLLGDLHFNQPHFEVKMSFDEQKLHENGAESLEFFMASNVGMEPKPMSKVASGGELSRMLLALSVVFQSVNPVHTLIFDEIDSGIGGLTANAVGHCLKEVSQTAQVFCITHFPQIARFADQHIHVSKQVENKKTVTVIKQLSSIEATQELTRLVGGEDVVRLFNA